MHPATSNSQHVGNFGSVQERSTLKRRRLSGSSGSCITCDFILGSVTDVERLWSLTNLVLSKGRSSLSSLTLESVALLNINQVYWNDQMVKADMIRVKQRWFTKYWTKTVILFN